nr:DUF4298 domain-containing protein [Lachnospiraceae bacterium]
MDETNNSQSLRIRHFEELRVAAEEMLEAYSKETADALKETIDALESYYTSPEWKKDFTDDEAGLLPADLKRGVLSEDGIYNLLERYREIESEEKKRALFLHQKETLDTF